MSWLRPKHAQQRHTSVAPAAAAAIFAVPPSQEGSEVDLPVVVAPAEINVAHSAGPVKYRWYIYRLPMTTMVPKADIETVEDAAAVSATRYMPV